MWQPAADTATVVNVHTVVNMASPGLPVACESRGTDQEPSLLANFFARRRFLDPTRLAWWLIAGHPQTMMIMTS